MLTTTAADVGGFFGNPEPEMLVRWYGVGIFSPFLRAHAHIDMKRREPFLLDEPYKGIVRDMLRLRYSMLPVWYTAFREASVTGLPVVRPHYVVFPKDECGFSLDDQYFVGGSGLLVKPVTTKGATEETVYLPEDQVSVLDGGVGFHVLTLAFRYTTTTSTTTPTAALLRARLSLSPPNYTKFLSSFVAARLSLRANVPAARPRS